jgi:class 3 adenylate cyclase
MPPPILEENPEIKAVVNRFLQALGAGDRSTLSNLFARDEGLRYIGTDFREWWQGPEVASVIGPHRADAPVVEIWVETEDVEGYSRGHVGWGAARGRLRFSDQDSHDFRHTAVFVLEAGYWRIVQAHNSLGRSNKEVAGVELTTTLGDLLKSIGDDTRRRFLENFDEGTVTLVFTDIEDSTNLAAQLGDARWTDAIKWHDGAIASITASHGGTLVKSLGDGAMLAFESTRMAARAAIGIQQAIEAPDAPVDLRLRIGIHIGDVVHTDDDLLGNAVNKAARIASSAEGGQIVVSRVVQAMLGESQEFTFGDTIEAELKGLPGLHEITPLHWADEESRVPPL